jgi:hypothetical protein
MNIMNRYALVSTMIVAFGATSPALAQEEPPEFGLPLTPTDELAIDAVLQANEAVGFVTDIPADLNGWVDIFADERQDQEVVALSIDNSPPVVEGPKSSVSVTATIDKEKDKRVLELVAKLKLAVIFVANVIRPEGAAESEVVVEQENQGNTVNHDFGTAANDDPVNPLAPYPFKLDAEIADSFNGNSGVVQGNQDVGNMVNQANVASVAVTDSATVFSDAQATASQHNDGNTTTTVTFIDPDQVVNPPPAHSLEVTKTARIMDSVNNNSGVVHVNQNAGDMNNQLNGTSMAIGLEGIVALSETDLGQFNTGNDVTDTNTVKLDIITGSVSGNSGIVNVNQSSGAMNNQATMISFAGIANIGVPTLPLQ